MSSATPPPRWTRRDFLRIGGLLGAGGLSIAALARLFGSSPGPVSTAKADGTVAPSGSAGTADVSAPRTRYVSRPDLTPPTVVVNVPAASEVAAGLIFMTPSNGNAGDGPMIVDDSGEMVWFRPDTGLWATNLQVVEYLGQPTLLWWEGSVNGGIGSGEVILADSSYHEIARIQAGNGYPADLHECRITPQGTAVLTGDAGVAGTSALGGGGVAGQVMDCGIWEVDIATGRLLFEWHGIDHVSLDETFVAAPTDPSAIWDYLHVNSIEVDSDGGLLVSARNTSAVYKVDRATGRIVWRLGGKRSDFSVGEGAAFSWQHDARRHDDGTISIFDDANDPSTSRAIFLDVDEQRMASTLVRAYARAEPVLAHSQGNVQLLPNGNVFVGWGDAPYCTEFGPDGRTLFDATYPAAKQSYRVVRFPWVGRPTDPPAIAVQPGAGGALTVYASWNGATEVAAWEVRAGGTESSLAPVARAERSGFETSIAVKASAVPAGTPLVAVDALDSGGRVLGSSPSFSVGG